MTWGLIIGHVRVARMTFKWIVGRRHRRSACGSGAVSTTGHEHKSTSMSDRTTNNALKASSDDDDKCTARGGANIDE